METDEKNDFSVWLLDQVQHGSYDSIEFSPDFLKLILDLNIDKTNKHPDILDLKMYFVSKSADYKDMDVLHEVYLKWINLLFLSKRKGG